MIDGLWLEYLPGAVQGAGYEGCRPESHREETRLDVAGYLW